MSVSGLHVGLLGGLLLLVLRLLRVRRTLRPPVLAVFLVGYCALTGFSAASVRAAVMLMLTQLAHLALRKPDPLTTLAAAMLAVLALDPLQAWSAGFVLSFSAMLGITVLLPPFRRLFARLFPHSPERIRSLRHALGRLEQSALSLLAVSLAAQVGVRRTSTSFRSTASRSTCSSCRWLARCSRPCAPSRFFFPPFPSWGRRWDIRLPCWRGCFCGW